MKKLINKFQEKMKNEGFRAALKATKRWLRRDETQGIGRFTFPKDLDIKTDIKTKYNYQGLMLELFAENKVNIVHKWHHFIPIYDRYFSPFINSPVRFLEIGVSKGGSLQMWRKYFGNDAIIFGIDIDPDCEKYNGIAAQVRIGSQADKKFLCSVIEEMGGVDIILDDGSHQMEHIPTSLQILFPKLSDGGIYFIEDLHTAYWSKFGGGYRSRANFFNDVREIIDDMHNWYHQKGMRKAQISECCSAIHIHDSIVVLEKNRVYPPTHSQVA